MTTWVFFRKVSYGLFPEWPYQREALFGEFHCGHQQGASIERAEYGSTRETGRASNAYLASKF
jgi:hypothetical protein